MQEDWVDDCFYVSYAMIFAMPFLTLIDRRLKSSSEYATRLSRFTFFMLPAEDQIC